MSIHDELFSRLKEEEIIRMKTFDLNHMLNTIQERCRGLTMTLTGKKLHPSDFFREIIEKGQKTILQLRQDGFSKQNEYINNERSIISSIDGEYISKAFVLHALDELNLKTLAIEKNVLGLQNNVFLELSRIWTEWRNHFDKHPEVCENEVNNLMKMIQDIFITKEIHAFIGWNRQLNLSFQKMESLIEKYECEKILNCISQMISTKIIGFPFKRFTMGRVQEKFLALKNYQANVDHVPFIPHNTNFITGNFFPFTYGENYVRLLSKHPEDYEKMDMLCDYFQEECRLQAKRKDQPLAPLNWWLSTSHNINLLRALYREHQDFDTYHLREGLYQLVKECTQFKPSVAISIYHFLGAKRVLDFCAGWGDRLIAAIASDCVEFYCGVDPNSSLQKGHQKIIATLCNISEETQLTNQQINQSSSPPQCSGLDSSDCFNGIGSDSGTSLGSKCSKEQKAVKHTKNPACFRMIYEPFQSANLTEVVADGLFNLIFTSPPFFDFESYTDIPGQSVNDYPQLNQWMRDFLFCSLEKSWNLLEYGGYMAIHIVDVFKTKVVEAMNLFIQAKLPSSNYCGVIGTVGLSNKTFPIWIWKKCDVSDGIVRVEEAKKIVNAPFSRSYYYRTQEKHQRIQRGE